MDRIVTYDDMIIGASIDEHGNVFSPYDEFVKSFNEATKRKENIKLYFSTNGGMFHLAQNMVDIMNNFPYKIEIYVTGYCYSAGVYIITNLRNDIKITLANASTYMVHLPNLDTNSKNIKDEDSWDYFISTTEQDSYDEYIKNIKHGLLENEVKKIKNGKEIYLKVDRMREIVN